MNDGSRSKSVVEDAGTSTQFINLTGKISRVLYCATHPEEIDVAEDGAACEACAKSIELEFLAV
jgi:hypothetical protein